MLTAKTKSLAVDDGTMLLSPVVIEEPGDIQPVTSGTSISRKSQLKPPNSGSSGEHSDSAIPTTSLSEVGPPAGPPAILFHVIFGDQVGEEFLVHADCAVGVMMDFIKRRVTEDKNIPEDAYLELFDDTGESLNLHKCDPFESRGIGFVKHRGVYFPMYFIPENIDSESEEIISSEGSSTKKDLDSQPIVDGVGEEWAGESPCEEDDLDDEPQNSDGNEVQIISKHGVSSSGSNTSVSSTSRPAHKSHVPYNIDEEEYGEDGHPDHYQPQMIQYADEFSGEDHHDDRHHPDKIEVIHTDEVLPASPPVQNVQEIPHDKSTEPKRGSEPHPNTEHAHVGTSHEDEPGLNQAKIPEQNSQTKIKKEHPDHPVKKPMSRRRTESKESQASSAKTNQQGQISGPRKTKLLKGKPVKEKKSVPHRGVFIGAPTPNKVTWSSICDDSPLLPEPEVQPPTAAELEAAEQSHFKIEDDGNGKIIYKPIICDDYQGCVSICKRVVDLHSAIDRGVQEAEAEPVEAPLVPSPPQEKETGRVPSVSKRQKGKGKDGGKNKKAVNKPEAPIDPSGNTGDTI